MTIWLISVLWEGIYIVELPCVSFSVEHVLEVVLNVSEVILDHLGVANAICPICHRNSTRPRPRTRARASTTEACTSIQTSVTHLGHWSFKKGG